MGWVRISDDWYDNDKIDTVGPLGAALHHAALAFCNRNLTDGYIRKSRLRTLLNFDGISVTTTDPEQFPVASAADDAARLVIGWMVQQNLIHEAGHDCESCHDREDGGKPSDVDYLVHDYFSYQPSREQVEAKAEANRKRVEAWREARKQGGNGVGNAVGNGVTTDVRNAPCNAPGNAGVQTPQPQPQPQVTTDVVTSSGATRKRAAPRKRIDADYMPPREVVDAIRTETGATDEQLRFQHSQFLDYWQGNGKPMADWAATWRKWMRTAQERGDIGRTVNGNSHRPSSTDDKASGWLEQGRSVQARIDAMTNPQTQFALEAM